MGDACNVACARGGRAGARTGACAPGPHSGHVGVWEVAMQQQVHLRWALAGARSFRCRGWSKPGAVRAKIGPKWAQICLEAAQIWPLPSEFGRRVAPSLLNFGSKSAGVGTWPKSGYLLQMCPSSMECVPNLSQVGPKHANTGCNSGQIGKDSPKRDRVGQVVVGPNPIESRPSLADSGRTLASNSRIPDRAWPSELWLTKQQMSPASIGRVMVQWHRGPQALAPEVARSLPKPRFVLAHISYSEV